MNETEQRICGCIDAHAQQLVAFAEDIYSHAELGYTEHRTAGKVADWLQSCGLDVQTGLANTGVKASLGSAAPSVCLIGELDGIRSPEHPLAVPKTGMSHACGHHMQLTALAGAALALSQPEVAAALTGRAVFFAVPCEEHVPMNRLEQLRSDGIATCCGGKPELLLRGAFDDIDAAQRMRTWFPVSRIFCSAATRPADFCPSSFTSRAEPLTQPLRRKTASMRWMS